MMPIKRIHRNKRIVTSAQSIPMEELHNLPDESSFQMGETSTPLPNHSLPRSNSESLQGSHMWQDHVDDAIMKKLKGYFRQRIKVEQSVLKMQKMIDNGTLLELPQLNVISNNLLAAFDEFNSAHNKVLTLVPDEAVSEQNDIFFAFEELYNYCSMAVEDLILAAKDKRNSSCVLTPKVIVQQQPLTVPVPTFDGSYANWPMFKAIFQDLMEKSADSDAIKLYHLDKALIGSAAGVLDAKIMSEGDYSQAWIVLSERFENQRFNVETHIRGLLSLKKISSESYKELRCLIDEVLWHVEGLRYLKQEFTGISEHIIVYLIVNALDKTARRAWESKQKKGVLPKYELTMDLLKSRCQVLESCDIFIEVSTVQTKRELKHQSIQIPE